LMSLSSRGSTTASQAYDGLDRRVSETASGTSRHFYYSAAWQVLEERVGGSASADRQFVWGQRYTDDLVLRDCSDYTPSRLYALQDPNWNATSLVDSTGAVQERFAYTGYSQPRFLSASFASRSSSAFSWETLYAGYRYDAIVFYYLARRRWLDYLTGRWLTRDPIDNDLEMLNLYEYCESTPLDATDPLGLVPIAGPLCAGCWAFTAMLIDIAAVACTEDDVDWYYGGSYLTCMLMEYERAYDAMPAITRAAAVAACLCCGGLAKKAIQKAATKLANRRLKKKIVTCLAIYAEYKAAEKAAAGCKPGLPCAAYTLLVAARTSEVAGRTAYLAAKCDYVLPGSIAKGSKKAEKNHEIELANKTQALAKCIGYQVAACAQPKTSGSCPK